MFWSPDPPKLLAVPPATPVTSPKFETSPSFTPRTDALSRPPDKNLLENGWLAEWLIFLRIRECRRSSPTISDASGSSK